MSSQPVASEIREVIQREGPITFARFMALALYSPAGGYYAGSSPAREPVGWAGDFFTSGDVSPLWGWAIARQLHQFWMLMGCPTSFHVVEPGGGRGLLARDVWHYVTAHSAEMAAALRYSIVESTPLASVLLAQRRIQLSADLEPLGVPAEAISWRNEVDLTEPIWGCVVSNELYDALPVHRVENCDGKLCEAYVSLGRGTERLVEELGPLSTPRLSTYLDRYGVDWISFPHGWRAEVALAAEETMRAWGGRLARGFVLSIDYGALAAELYSGDRMKGTLGIYRQHRFSDDPLRSPGESDITAHVNFSALMRSGERAGLRTLGYLSQAEFLRNLGVREEAARIAAERFPLAETERHTDRGQADLLRQKMLLSKVGVLLQPGGLGDFRVLVQSKGLPEVNGQSLLGVRQPGV